MGASYFAATNKDSETIRRGQWVAIHPSGSGVWLASAADDTRNAVGMMSADTAPGSANNVITDEVFTMNDWSDVIGADELEGGAIYFLSTVPGQMSTSAPTTIGQVAQELGRAISAIGFDVDTEEAILL